MRHVHLIILRKGINAVDLANQWSSKRCNAVKWCTATYFYPICHRDCGHKCSFIDYSGRRDVANVWSLSSSAVLEEALCYSIFYIYPCIIPRPWSGWLRKLLSHRWLVQGVSHIFQAIFSNLCSSSLLIVQDGFEHKIDSLRLSLPMRLSFTLALDSFCFFFFFTTQIRSKCANDGSI